MSGSSGFMVCCCVILVTMCGLAYAWPMGGTWSICAATKSEACSRYHWVHVGGGEYEYDYTYDEYNPSKSTLLERFSARLRCPRATMPHWQSSHPR